MLTVYTFVFSIVLKSRWGVDNEDFSKFSAILFIGLVVNSLFVECINRAPSLLIINQNYVKKVVFPLEVLIYVSVGSSLFHSLISLFVLSVAVFFLFGSISWNIILFPVILTPLVLILCGLSWMLASLGVYVRDLSQAVGVITSAMAFFAPVFYPMSSIPNRFKSMVMLNPITFPILEGRNLIIFGLQPDWVSWSYCFLCGVIVCYTGFLFFQKTRQGFSDVL